MKMLTPGQVRWAASHDWFISDCGDGTIMIRDGWTLNGVYDCQIIRHTGSFKALRDWAGY
jgi:hypothetical protein